MEDIIKKVVKIAKDNGLEPAVLLAVKYVEVGSSNGFYHDGRPVILFEGHIFYQQLKIRVSSIELQKLMAKYPTLIYPTWTNKYYQGGMKECDRLEAAAKINREAALMSCSWGLCQIMGFNYIQCGCKTIQEFVNAMYKSTDKQLELWVKFLKSGRYLEKLKKHDWEGFAKAYNGPGYKKNRYDTKLAEAYESYKKQLENEGV